MQKIAQRACRVAPCRLEFTCCIFFASGGISWPHIGYTACPVPRPVRGRVWESLFPALPVARMSRSKMGRTARTRRRRARRGNRAMNGTQEVTQSLVTMKPSYGPTVRISRSVSPFSWSTTSPTLTDSSFGVGWSLNDLPNFSEFVGMFAQWRLRRASITMTFLAGTITVPVTLYFGVDPFVDPASPPTLTEALQRPHRTWTPNAMRTTLQIRPQVKVCSAVLGSPGSTATIFNSTAPLSQWYDCSNASAVNYGTFWAVVQSWTNTTGSFRVHQEFELEFRGTR